ncbi:MAG: nuclear transport factor 2 family protein [Gemmatimonadota bacterium]
MKARTTLFVALLIAAAPLAAQEGHVPRAEADLSPEQAAVMAPVDMLFDGMRAKDTAMIRAAFVENGGLTGPGRAQDGSVVIRTTTVDEFVTTIGNFERVIDEPLFDVEVRIDGPLATVWAEYDVFMDGDFSHCGVDAFQLVQLADGWKILTIADTRRRQGCERIETEG